MAKQLKLEEALKGEIKSVNGDVIYSDKQRKKFGIYKTLGGAGLVSTLGYLLMNAYMELNDPNASFGYRMTNGQAEAVGILYPAFAAVTFVGGLFILFGAYVLKDGLKDLKNSYKKSKV